MIDFRGKKRQIFILLALCAFLILVNYGFLDKQLGNFLDDSQFALVERVIDGDTIETEEETIRLLGINTPERGERYYAEAKDFLNNLILNKTIKLEFTNDRTDKYGRTLAYVFLEEENINVKIVENGMGNPYFYSGRDIYSEDLEKAWNKCINSNRNLCETSTDKCAECINISATKGFIINACSFSCNISEWEIKGEGREKWIFNKTLSHGEATNFELNLENSGGSLYLRDREGKLVI